VRRLRKATDEGTVPMDVSNKVADAPPEKQREFVEEAKKIEQAAPRKREAKKKLNDAVRWAHLDTVLVFCCPSSGLRWTNRVFAGVSQGAGESPAHERGPISSKEEPQNHESHGGDGLLKPLPRSGLIVIGPDGARTVLRCAHPETVHNTSLTCRVAVDDHAAMARPARVMIPEVRDNAQWSGGLSKGRTFSPRLGEFR
jgi:hypothetical protein